MKKKIAIFLVSFALLLLVFGTAHAQLCDERRMGPDGKRIGLVPCGNTPACSCTIGHFFVVLESIYDFIVWNIATPLAVLMLTIGGVMILISAGNPNLAGMGKKILWVSIIGLVLVFCSWLIVSFILGALGYTGAWNTL